MSALLIPFPSRRRAALIARVAAQTSQWSRNSASRYIDQIVQQTVTRLERLKISSDLARADGEALRAAIHRLDSILRALRGAA